MNKLLITLFMALAISARAQIQHSEIMEQPLVTYQDVDRGWIMPAINLALGGQVNTTNSPPPLPGTNNATGILGWLAPLGQATNYAFEPYATYAPSAPSKWGGGILAVYNLSDYVAPGLGIDYLGHFSLVSASITLRLPINVGKYITFFPGLTNVTVVPGVLAGMGEPLSGTGGSAAPTTIADALFYVQYGHLLGGEFNFGVAYGKWFNAGEYSVDRYHLFAGWSKGF